MPILGPRPSPPVGHKYGNCAEHRFARRSSVQGRATLRAVRCRDVDTDGRRGLAGYLVIHQMSVAAVCRFGEVQGEAQERSLPKALISVNIASLNRPSLWPGGRPLEPFYLLICASAIFGHRGEAIRSSGVKD